MRFSIVTPCLNAETYIAETIDSVISQRGVFSIQYIIVDGGSNDGTEAIVRDRQEKLRRYPDGIHCQGVSLLWISQRDDSMYQALNLGFSQAEGEVLAWINSDDVYQPGAFEAVRCVFEQCPEVQWLKGITDYIDQFSMLEKKGLLHLYGSEWLRAGVYGRELQFVQQDSVFWRASLWWLVGGFPRELRLAGDYWLWTRFANYALLYSLDAHVSCFRRQPGQLSEDREGYRREMDTVCTHRPWKACLARRLFASEDVLQGRLFRNLCRWLTGNERYQFVRIATTGRVEILSSDYGALRCALKECSG